MELKEIENFLKIAEFENITQAAEALHMSQPPLTRQLQNLEAELGVRLFTREKKRIHITEEGRFFQQQSKQLLALLDKTKEQICQMRSGISGTLYIGAIETAGTALISEWISGFKALYPNVRYSLWSANSDDVMDRLEKGLLDVALIREPFDGEKFHSVHIFDEPWIVLLPEKHPLTEKAGAELTLEELADEPLIVPARRSEEISQWFAQRGLEADITCQYAPLLNGVILTERELGVAICPASAQHVLAGRRLVVKALAEPHSSGVSLIWRIGIFLSAAAEKFIEYVGSYML